MEGELGVVEVTQHRVLVSHIHGHIMVGALPLVIFCLMAVPAFFTADKCCRSLAYDNVTPVLHYRKIIERQRHNDDNRCEKAG